MDDEQFVVIGGSHGIGRGIVDRLLERGASVTVVSRTGESLDSVKNVTHIAADVTNPESDLSQLPSSIAGMAYCPGSINLGPIRGLKTETMTDDFQLNVIGAIRCLQASLAGMKAAGSSSFVMFSTVAVAQGLPMHASVSAAKGAVEGLTRSLAAELAPTIRVNCVAPALTETRLASRFLSSESKREAMSDKYPLKRVGHVSDIASMADFLLSSDSSWITGQVIGVDGGMSALRV